MKWPWRSRHRPTVAAAHVVRTASAGSEVLTEARAARADVTARVSALARTGALDAGNGDVLDAWLERLRSTWRTQLERERTVSNARAREALPGLRSRVLETELAAQAATARVNETQRALDQRASDIFRDDTNSPQRERRRRPRPKSDPLEGLTTQVGSTVLLYSLLLLAAMGDVVTFNLVLSSTFAEAGPEIVWPLTLAFAGASVGLMHAIGRALRNLREGHGGLGRVAIGLMMAAWLGLGVVAVYFRANRHTPQLGSTQQSSFDVDTAAETAAAAAEAQLSAILLAGLFLAAGLMAFYTGYAEFHPRASSYRALAKELRRRHVAMTEAAAQAELAQQELAHAQGEEERAAQRLADGLAETDATVDELKELVRVLAAEHIGLPEATSGLTSLRTNDHTDGGGPPALVPDPRDAPDGRTEPATLAPAGDLTGGSSLNGNGATRA